MTRRTVHDLVAEAKADIEELTAEQVKAELDAGTAMLIDIRDIRERVEKGVIPGAVSAPRGMLEFWFDPESPYHQERYTPEGDTSSTARAGGDPPWQRRSSARLASQTLLISRLVSPAGWKLVTTSTTSRTLPSGSSVPDASRSRPHAGRHGAGSSG